MPVYDTKCDNCGVVLEVTLPEPPPDMKCAYCKNGTVRRVYSFVTTNMPTGAGKRMKSS